ncbi:hypothetical protein BO221_44085 [Archangium sp. Cb G35]|uniref:hypothetical protein n=1 Tax=Archangium sp. Cb G35 TaxID=1920190 RepID=UPI00093611BB|nr:hypothetical protein [Archangium sp. Cb G35]OJT17557.1 hypothetical protein BO221_44085 [Archangium sp. Cb G35]
MKPLAANRLVLSRKQHRACTLSITRAELEQHLGPPLAIDDEGDGLGPRYRWECQGECGLEMLIDLPRDGAQEAVLWMKHLEVEHALEHLGLSTEHVLWRADMLEPLPLDGWAVVRQDNAGNRFDICVLSVPDHAECLARLLETRVPEQSYAMEGRGLKPAPRRTPSRGWAPPSHDEHTASL